jgi:uncharacterized repeat protein (TIGR03803 family)
MKTQRSDGLVGLAALLSELRYATAVRPQSPELRLLRKPQMLVAAILALALIAIATPPANAQLSFDLLHTFTGGTDGNYPVGGVIQDADGNLYGTTAFGGSNCGGQGCGTVFKIDKNGQYTVLYRFLGGSDGAAPRASLARDAAGNLYGTTQGQGGVGAVSTVFKVDKHGNETVLFNFNQAGVGGSANSTPILDAEGNLYGTTPAGFVDHCHLRGNIYACGLVFRLSKSGAFKVVHTFKSRLTGINPNGNLVMDASGNLYGTTVLGGFGGSSACGLGYNFFGCGTVFKIGKNGKFSLLHVFHGKADGSFPVGVIGDGAGNLYGITDSGGELPCSVVLIYGCGTIFKIDNAGKFSVLYKFHPEFPGLIGYNNLVRDSKGNLYGTNQGGGTHGGGYLFELDAKGSFTVLYSFPPIESSDGNIPTGAVIAPNGDFYGTLGIGGDLGCGNLNEGCGTVFKLTP